MDEAIEEAQDGVAVGRMLDEIGQAVEPVGLVRELAAGTKLFRGRVGPRRRPYRSPQKLGPLADGRNCRQSDKPYGNSYVLRSPIGERISRPIYPRALAYLEPNKPGMFFCLQCPTFGSSVCA